MFSFSNIKDPKETGKFLITENQVYSKIDEPKFEVEDFAAC